MKRFSLATSALALLAGTANAADYEIPDYNPEVPTLYADPAPIHDWSGFYIFGLAGHISDEESGDFPYDGLTLNREGNAWGIGGGYRRQLNNSRITVGIEGKFLATNAEGTHVDEWFDPCDELWMKNTVVGRLDELATVQIQVGVAAGREGRLHVSAGVGGAMTNSTRAFEVTASDDTDTWRVGGGDASSREFGWSATLAADYAINDKMFIGGDVTYFDTGAAQGTAVLGRLGFSF